MSENLVIVSRAEQARERYRLSYSAGDLESPAEESPAEYGQQCRVIKTPSIVSGGDWAWVVAVILDFPRLKIRGVRNDAGCRLHGCNKQNMNS